MDSFSPSRRPSSSFGSVSHRHLGVRLEDEKRAGVAHLLVPRGAFGGDVEATIVVDGDVDLILRESGKVGGDLKLALLLEHVAVEIELIGDAADGVAMSEDGVAHAHELWRDETTTGDEEGCEAVRRAGRESTERGEGKERERDWRRAVHHALHLVLHVGEGARQAGPEGREEAGAHQTGAAERATAEHAAARTLTDGHLRLRGGARAGVLFVRGREGGGTGGAVSQPRERRKSYDGVVSCRGRRGKRETLDAGHRAAERDATRVAGRGPRGARRPTLELAEQGRRRVSCRTAPSRSRRRA